MATSSQYVTEPPSALECVICLEVAEDPWQHGQCGRLLCKGCKEKLGRNQPCPNCRREHPQYFEDNKSKREIKALPIKCSSVERGCEWEGTAGTLQGHVATCGFNLVPCPKCSGSTEEIECFMRKDLKRHLENDCPNRDYECKHCGQKDTYAFITEDHDKVCKKKILPCPNAGCGQTMERQLVDEHVRTECPHTVMLCKYGDIGCAAELKRGEMAAHEQDDKLHLQMALDTVITLKEETRTMKNNGSVTYMVSNFQEKLEADMGFSFLNSPFYTHPNGYRMTLTVDANGHGDGEGTHVAVFVSILKGKYDAELKWPFIGKYTFTLLNQLEDNNHISRTSTFTAARNARVGSEWGYGNFISHTALAHDPVKNIQYLKDDTLYFRLSVEVADHKPWLQ